MWFAFGLVTVLAGGAVMAYRRRAADWSGTSVAGYTHRIKRGKTDKIEQVRIGVDTRTTLDFECKPESGLDRFSKRSGLSRESQSGHRAFDDALYLVSDDRRVAAALRTTPALADDLLSLFRSGRPQFEATRLTCRGGRVWIDFDANGEQDSASELFDACVPALQRVAAVLPTPTPGAGRTGDPLLLRSVLVLALSSGLAINGALQLVRTGFEGAFTVDLSQLWLYALALAGALLLAMCLLAVVLLGRSSRFHLVLVELLLVGSFGAVATSFTQLRDYNQEFDRGAVEQRASTIEGKRTATGRKGRRKYYFTLADWNGSATSVERRVPASLYRRVEIGEELQIRQHPGRLGMRWVEGLDDTN